ncbi:hypothetical protein CDAR_422001 [Caerostris darwini]|uniref:Uncharacterized protein n=1 Tax=Caerostris darwini TaxID=1538125 RepID=A0AAV4PDQ3_9ARAC|nr:hypothetical protein CDAR_422001 [Caerostris darwini]
MALNKHRRSERNSPGTSPPFFYLFTFLLKREERDNDAPPNDVGIKGGNRFDWTHRETLIGFCGRFRFAALDRLASFLLDAALSSAMAVAKGCKIKLGSISCSLIFFLRQLDLI